MPIFEYHCERCENTFEVLQRNNQEAVSCKLCGSAKVEKLLSTFSPSVASSSPAPCHAGQCPSQGMAGTGCSSGGCPLSS